MSYSVEWIPEDCIVLLTINSEWNMTIMPESNPALMTVMDQADQEFTLVVDALDMNINFGDVVASMSAVTKGSAAPFTHPNLRQIIVLTESSLLSMAARALGQVQYGQLKSEVFSTLDEALAYIRSAN